MRWIFLGTTILALAACSKAPEAADDRAERDRAATFDVAESAPSGGDMRVPGVVSPPSIGVTAAPGVAFNYRYAFRLPSERIAGAQEAHAQACEKLGIARCRITGMRYRLIGENDVEAQLAFKLDPAIARLFGKQGIDAVKAAEGTLVEAEITGTDAGAAIDRLAVERARAAEERRRLDEQLAKLPAKSTTERTELQNQRAEAERRIAATSDATAQERDSLANTPMVFEYGSGRAIRGFDASAPFRSAFDTAIGSIEFTLAFVLGAIALLGPPALLLALLWFLWRRFRGSFPRPLRADPMQTTNEPNSV